MRQQSTIERVAKAYGVAPDLASRLFRAPTGSQVFHAHNTLGWHTVHAQHGDSGWTAETSVHPVEKRIVYHNAEGQQGQNNSLHTVRSLITARDLGLHSAHIHTALGSGTGNGAYTYLRLGFNGDIDPVYHDDYLKMHARHGRKVPTTIKTAQKFQDLMRPGAARDFWKEHHWTLHNLKFDLRPGSDSFQRLHDYLAERAAQGRPTR